MKNILFCLCLATLIQYLCLLIPMSPSKNSLDVANQLANTPNHASRGIAQFSEKNVSIFSFTVPCNNGDKEEMGVCKNKDLPLSPSIKRFLGKAGEKESFPGGIPISAAEDRYELNLPDRMYKVFPYMRPTLDGRLYLGSGNNWTNYPQTNPKSIPDMGGFAGVISYLDPENFDYDQRINNGNPMVTSLPIHPIVHLTYHSQKTSLPFNQYIKNQTPGTYHFDFCHDQSDSGGKYYPRFCQAYLDTPQGQTADGDCYDVTIFSYSSPGDNLNEIRTVPVTIFVQRPKSEGAVEELVLYPRISTGILPSLVQMKNLPNIGNSSDSSKSNIKFLSDQCLNASGNPIPNSPLYCQFIYAQKRITSIKVNGVTKTYPYGPPFFEPSISGDGRLLVINFGLGRGLQYSYNSAGKCNADGWKDFYRLSNMPFDANIYQNYPIAKAQRTVTIGNSGIPIPKGIPFQDGMGNPILENQEVEGAYFWMDREVRNVFFNAVNLVQDNFKGIKGKNNSAVCNDDNPDCVIDAGPGKGLHVLGAWTRGKMIHIDSVVNMFDFGFRPNRDPNQERVVEMELYKDEVTTLRPSGMTVIGSPENVLNYYDALSPVAPFDVVWKFSTNIERTGEIIFDDYLNRFLYLGTHFNQSTTSKSYPGGTVTLYKNGWVPQKDNFSGTAGTKSNFQLKEVPLLQNISTNSSMEDASKADKNFHVLGGARVEPIAQGGVIGKGLFLDGNNDSAAILVDTKYSGSAFLLTIWVDSRSLDTNERVIFGFPDYSSIALTNTSIIAKTCSSSGACLKKNMPYGQNVIQNGKFFHLSLKIESFLNPKENPNLNSFKWIRRLTYYINGTQLMHNKTYQGMTYKKKFLEFGFNDQKIQGFDFYYDNRPGPFSIGRQNLLGAEKAFRGWVDEFRVYKFRPSRIPAAYPIVPSFYNEILCNQALGSNVNILPSDSSSNDSLKSLYQRAANLNHFLEPTNKNSSGMPPRHPFDKDYVYTPIVNSTIVCEQLKMESYSSHGEFADQRKHDLICADKVHTNQHEDHFSRCLHKSILNIADKPLIFDQPRPDFSEVLFCISCHRVGDKIPALSIDALKKNGSINREDDFRRQPLDYPRTITGCVPDDEVFENSADDCNSQKLKMDYFFDQKFKIVPKKF